MEFKPTTLNERIDSIDIIRGFSLLGILLVNIFGFYLPMPHIDLQNWFTEAMDIIWHQTLDIYVQSSFYPLFSMLFGYGIAMQYLKAEKTGVRFYSFARKRLIVLFVLGMLHALFIWWGDILAMYAFCGFFLLLFIRFNPKMILTFGLVIYGLLHVMILGGYGMLGIANEKMEAIPVNIVMVESALSAYGIGGWGEAFSQRLNDLTVQMNPSMWIFSLFTILPYMLIGAAFAKWRLIERAKSLKGLWISFAVICNALGLFIKSAPFMYERTYLLEYLKVYIGGPILAIGYMALIVCICLLPFATKILQPIGLAGRMSLTIYIMQSIICTIIFYDYGFGLYGQVNVQMGVLIALVIFIVQIIFALSWFMKFKQGPLEYAVKKITYKTL
ncbi:DUF418 domain-containing protein [Ureibacillus acetophenoni]|uniref:DUF418 domain-containing protein n=1 Tax=Ureibacillus acetophenoni TaxID=614649 RepID=A0A285TZD1_9BACL|nr:DUF418 domain-containing protein [Ureibacillus acetophenoni]SOC35044.1 uncharacterized protein SAMN05877842_101225 [Ureibacillus acetophenoni]